MRKKKIPILVLALLLTLVIGFRFDSAKLANANTTAVIDMSSELTNLYGFMDDVDKFNILQAKAKIATMNDAAWNDILDGNAVTSPGVLITPQVLANYNNDRAAAKADVKAFMTDLMTIIYDGNNASALTDRLIAFKATYTPTFQKVFGATATIDDLFTLFVNGKNALQTVVSQNKTLYLDDLAYGNNSALVQVLPTLLKSATQEALNNSSSIELRGMMGLAGISADLLIDKTMDVLRVVDPQQDALISFGKAIIRSQATLVASIPTVTGSAVTIDGKMNPMIQYSLSIMNNEATSLVAWHSSNTSAAAIDARGIVMLVGNGTTTLSIYRDAPGATPETDWIVKPITITVTGFVTGGTITGRALLEQKTNNDNSGIRVVIEGNATNYNATTAVDGSFTFSSVPAGTYNLIMHKNGYLVSNATGLVVTEGNTTALTSNITLKAGDSNNDNIVNIADLSNLATSYGATSTADPKYAATVDFNGDGKVNIADLSMLATNYTKTGFGGTGYVRP